MKYIVYEINGIRVQGKIIQELSNDTYIVESVSLQSGMGYTLIVKKEQIVKEVENGISRKK